MPDTLTPEQRSYCMSRVKNKDTSLEMCIRSKLQKRGLRFKKNVKYLYGKPDIVFHKVKVAVFIDGDFWHGFRFPQWKYKIPEFWQEKISKNRSRDQRNFRKLRKMGWHVIRIWQHEIKRDIEACTDKIISAIETSKAKDSADLKKLSS